VTDTTRREFLAKTAAVAGAAGLASVLPADALINRGVRAASAIPSPQDIPVDTFVVLMMENRSFDHYFGWFPGADGNNQLTYPDENGAQHPTHPLAPDFQGCGFKDPDHGWNGGREEYNDGALDGFLKVNDEYAIGYYEEQDLPFIPHVAKAFTLYDRWFCSILGPTYVNRHYQWAAQSGGSKTNVLPPPNLGWTFETIFDRAQALGISVRYYNSDLPFGLLYGKRAQPWVRPVSEYYADAEAGQLPNICFVDPPFTDGGGGDGLSGDEHPAGDIRIGQAFMSDITHAFMNSPQWNTGAMFINYDEWGGFFDHVSPPKVPDDRESADLAEDFGQTGFRIPGVAVSPFARRDHVSHMNVTHESILKLISHKFQLGYLNKRHRYASNIGTSFDWANPDFSIPTLPDPAAPIPLGTGPAVTAPCSVGGAPQTRRSAAAAEDEGVELNSQAMIDYVEQVGFDYEPWKPSDVFSKPDSVVKSLLGKD
jgi:phospholipase C